jgi:hypothetical protein
MNKTDFDENQAEFFSYFEVYVLPFHLVFLNIPLEKKFVMFKNNNQQANRDAHKD